MGTILRRDQKYILLWPSDSHHHPVNPHKKPVQLFQLRSKTTHHPPKKHNLANAIKKIRENRQKKCEKHIKSNPKISKKHL